MPGRDARVDAYIEGAADWAKPILIELRAIVHAACPGAEEEIKWKGPWFTYKGMLCCMAAFKEYCAMAFWKETLVEPDEKIRRADFSEQLGRIRSLADLPSRRTLTAYIKKAASLNEAGVPLSRRAKAPAPMAKVPKELAAALKKHKRASAAFNAFSPSHKREYIAWIGEARQAETRDRRVATAIDWISENKPRNWKYTRKS